ncbi:MAG: aminotransferase class I/II-fold pyridoxal phosphate-dependent enzyme [Deltaproteobacteria bacterium]|nr:MAG: aminotransferase class I/II-fold pyridoxal phosphate-dependent enzyme [Deltaproteobacteria bacterium]
MNPIAQELNETIQKGNPNIYDMLSSKGKNLYFPKGILSQGAEAKEKASKFNATIGIATQNGVPMHLPSVMSYIPLPPDQSLSYAPSFGLLNLRKTWQQHMVRKNPSLAGKPISLPIVTNAITHGLSVTAEIWIDENDVIILPDKIWGNYNLIFAVLHGAKIRQYPLFSSQGGFNLSSFEDTLQQEALNKEKIVVLLNFPNNPTGYTPVKKEGKRIVEILIRLAENGKNVLALMDDAYFGLFYDANSMKESLFALLAEAHPRIMAVKLDAATKENYVWGLRVGFITYGTLLKGNPRGTYDALEKKTAGAVRGTISNSPHLSQSIILGSLNSQNYQIEKEEKFRIMLNRASRVKEVLANSKYEETWDVYPFNSGYFMCLRLKTVDAEKLRLHLLNRYGVGVISLGKTDIRVAFSCVEEEDIPELFDIIFQGAKDLEKGRASTQS